MNIFMNIFGFIHLIAGGVNLLYRGNTENYLQNAKVTSLKRRIAPDETSGAICAIRHCRIQR